MNIDYKTATAKDIFLLRLAGEELDFGLLSDDDYLGFAKKVIDLNLLEYFGQKDWRGIVAQFRATEDFKFAMNDTTRPRNVAIAKHDYLAFTELLESSDYRRDALPMNIGLHSIHMHFDNGQRGKIYKKWNLDV